MVTYNSFSFGQLFWQMLWEEFLHSLPHPEFACIAYKGIFTPCDPETQWRIRWLNCIDLKQHCMTGAILKIWVKKGVQFWMNGGAHGWCLETLIRDRLMMQNTVLESWVVVFFQIHVWPTVCSCLLDIMGLHIIQAKIRLAGLRMVDPLRKTGKLCAKVARWIVSNQIYTLGPLIMCLLGA